MRRSLFTGMWLAQSPHVRSLLQATNPTTSPDVVSGHCDAVKALASRILHDDSQYIKTPLLRCVVLFESYTTRLFDFPTRSTRSDEKQYESST